MRKTDMGITVRRSDGTVEQQRIGPDRAADRRKALHAAQEQAITDERLKRVAESKQRLAAYKPPPATKDQLAIVQRHLVTIYDQITVKGKKRNTVVETERAVTLVDLMHRDKIISMDQWQAAERLKELYFAAEGKSQGTANYGEFEAGSEPWTRIPTTDKRMALRDEFYLACFAAFAVPTNEMDHRGAPKWVVDAELMKWGILAMVNDKRNVTQTAIGNALSPYTGEKQKAAAGGQSIKMLLDRLTLHFRYRQR